MKRLLFFLLISTLTIAMNAQNIKARPLKKGMSIVMPRTADDDMPGTRGASITWHPLQKKYYAAMAGNARYPLGIYDATGKQLSADELSCEADTRGLWYNPSTKQIQGNSYDEGGWFNHKLDAKGMVVETIVFLEGMNQPDGQSVGVYNPLKKEVLFLFEGEVTAHGIADGFATSTLEIKWGQSKANPELEGAELIGDLETPEDYNYTSLVYTGIKGSELGFLNTTNREIELYDINTGYMKGRLSLPESAPVNASFNFAFANGMYWLFDMETRTWTGYK